MTNNAYTTFRNSGIDTACLGLEQQEMFEYYCTPVGADVIGWTWGGVHYCFIPGFGEMVFAVDPENYCGHNVFPLANNFADFIGLILATKNTNALLQIINWDKDQFLQYLNDPEEVAYTSSQKVSDTLDILHTSLGIDPISNPFEYVKALQQDFPYDQIPFSDAYYDATEEAKPIR